MLNHLCGVFVELRVVLNDNDRVVGLLQDRHELEDREGPADLQGLKSAVQLGQNTGIVAGDIKHPKPLQIQILVQGLDEHGSWRHQDIE